MIPSEIRTKAIEAAAYDFRDYDADMANRYNTAMESAVNTALDFLESQIIIFNCSHGETFYFNGAMDSLDGEKND